jgi:hypothetical protein
VADWLRRRSSALWQTGYRGGRLLCGRLVIETGYRGGRLLCGRLVEEEVVCSVADWLRRR